MYKSLLSLAAVATLTAFAGSGPTAAADRTSAVGAYNQQNVSEEVTSQRRVRRGRVIVRRGYWGPRRYVVRGGYWGWGPRRYWAAPYPYAYPYAYPYTYAGYYPYYGAYAYPYGFYRRPFISVGFGFGRAGFGFW
jgi:hypothetical protein